MQERRTTVRTPCSLRAQYCAAEDLLPRDGRMVDLSERGAGLWVREAHRAGEPITASFSLPGSSETLTATGVIRWSLPAKGRWYPLGIEWLPMEESTRNRLHTFLVKSPAKEAAPSAAESPQMRAPVSWFLLGLWVVAVALVGVVIWLWASALQREAGLRNSLSQRNSVISALKQREQRLAAREAWLQQELVTAKVHLATAADEMTRLDGQTQELAADAHRLSREVGLFEQSYATVQQERAGLIQEVMNLEQERLKLIGKLSSLPDLHVAIREAIESRKTEKTEKGAGLFSKPSRDADITIDEYDNQGFIIRDGRSTFTRRNAGSPMWIRVHEPEASSSK